MHEIDMYAQEESKNTLGNKGNSIRVRQAKNKPKMA